MAVMVSATSLVTLYVGLELQSLSAYVLASYGRTDDRSAEAGLKYFVLGALSSGLLLYGMKQALEREGMQPVKDPGINMLDKVKKFLFRDD